MVDLWFGCFGPLPMGGGGSNQTVARYKLMSNVPNEPAETKSSAHPERKKKPGKEPHFGMGSALAFCHHRRPENHRRLGIVNTMSFAGFRLVSSR